jgi:hypothetical protein
MIDPAELLLRASRVSPFPANSRYHGVPVATGTDAAGRPVAFLRRRFVPPADRFPAAAVRRVAAGDRPDVLAAEAFGDPELGWRLCDANGVLDPDELVRTPGRLVRVPGPGMQGGQGLA